MLIIRDAQMRALEHLAATVFVDRVAGILAENWPQTVEKLGRERFREAIAEAVEEVRDQGFGSKQAIARYLNAMLALNRGRGFDQAPHDWVVALLANPGLGEFEKIEKLTAQTRLRLQNAGSQTKFQEVPAQ